KPCAEQIFIKYNTSFKLRQRDLSHGFQNPHFGGEIGRRQLPKVKAAIAGQYYSTLSDIT
ncbi:hypothetical protein J7K50_00450, partial [bacterium]|nr:hypothetical protein [bacterium]